MNNLDEISKIEVDLCDFPEWFIKQTEVKKEFETDKFVSTFCEHPSLHLVFKSEKYLNNFKEPHTKSSKYSAFIKTQKKLVTLIILKKVNGGFKILHLCYRLH